MQGNRIIYGLYDKNQSMTEKDLLLVGKCPTNFKSVSVKEDDFFMTATISRRDYEMGKNYHGWYLLVPQDMKPVNFTENNISNIPCEMVKIKSNNGLPLVVEVDGQKHNVYGKFNVAKTSDNWKLKVTLRR